VQDQRTKRHHLQDGLEFAEAVGGDDHPHIRGDGPKARHGDFPTHDDHGHPGLDPAEHGQHDEQRGDQQFIRQGIKELPQIGEKISPSCHHAVHNIGHRGGDEKEHGDQTGDPTGEIQQQHQHGHDRDTGQSQVIGEIEHGAACNPCVSIAVGMVSHLKQSAADVKSRRAGRPIPIRKASYCPSPSRRRRATSIPGASIPHRARRAFWGPCSTKASGNPKR